MHDLNLKTALWTGEYATVLPLRLAIVGEIRPKHVQRILIQMLTIENLQKLRFVSA